MSSFSLSRNFLPMKRSSNHLIHELTINKYSMTSVMRNMQLKCLRKENMERISYFTIAMGKKSKLLDCSYLKNILH
jgi:hypothetical protein